MRPDGVVGLERDTCSSDARTVRLLQRQRPHRSLQWARTRHRLNPRGNRKLNHALQLAAVTQVRHNTPGSTYSQRKIAEGKSKRGHCAP